MGRCTSPRGTEPDKNYSTTWRSVGPVVVREGIERRRTDSIGPRWLDEAL